MGDGGRQRFQDQRISEGQCRSVNDIDVERHGWSMRNAETIEERIPFKFVERACWPTLPWRGRCKPRRPSCQCGRDRVGASFGRIEIRNPRLAEGRARPRGFRNQKYCTWLLSAGAVDDRPSAVVQTEPR